MIDNGFAMCYYPMLFEHNVWDFVDLVVAKIGVLENSYSSIKHRTWNKINDNSSSNIANKTAAMLGAQWSEGRKNNGGDIRVSCSNYIMHY